MKIISCCFRNINSIKGTSPLIDFEKGLLGEAGIFAITGPTGSGKTTILDAICVALYGRTPRLSTGSVEELMTRHTADCFAEVEFSTGGRRFRSHWSLKRARNKADGKIQPVRMELAEVTGESDGLFREEKILEEKKSLVVERVEEVTGLDFNRFTRSILLAQGNFAAFLNAKEKEQADLLEKMTGTEIYSLLSTRVFELARDEKNYYDELLREKQNLDILDAEEIKEQEDKIEEINKRIRQLRLRGEQLQEQKNWHRKIKELETIITGCGISLEQLKNREEGVAADLGLLKMSEKAAFLRDSYGSLKALRGQYEKTEQEIRDLETRLPDLEIEEEESLADLEGRRKERELFNEKRRETEELIGRVIVLDTQILDAVKNTAELHKGLKEEQSRINLLEKRREEDAAGMVSLQKSLDSCNLYLTNHKAWEGITGDLSLVLCQLDDLKQCRINRSGLMNSAGSNMNARKAVECKLAQQENLLKDIDRREQSLKAEIFGHEKLLKEKSGGLLLTGWEEKERGFRKLLEGIRFLREKERALNQAREQVEELKAQLADNTGSMKTADEKYGKGALNLELEQTILGQLEEKEKLEILARKLESNRPQLIAGEPCPLCGSPEHPWAGDIPQISDSREAIGIQKNKIKKEQKVLQHLFSEIGELKGKIEQATGDLEKQKRKIMSLSGEWMHVAKKYDITILPEVGDELSLREEDVSGQLSDCSRILQELKELGEWKSTGEKKLAGLTEKQHTFLMEHQNLVNRREQLVRDEKRFGEELLKEGKQEAELTSSLKEFLDIIEESVPSAGKEQVLMTRISGKGNQYMDSRKKREELIQRISPLEDSVREINGRLTGEKENFNKEVLRLNKSEEHLRYLKDERIKLFGEKDPGYEKRELEERYQGLLKRVKEGEGDHKKIYDALLKLRNTFHRQLEQRTELQARKELQEKEFRQQLEEQGFPGEVEFEKALLAPEKQKALAGIAEALSRERIELSTRQGDAEKQLKAEKGRALTTAIPESIDRGLMETAGELEARQRDIGELFSVIKKQEKLKDQLARQLEKLEKQKKERDKWMALNSLIGSRAGDKFKRFAQGLTLELLINLANDHLAFFTDRYLLCRDTEQELGLEVIDSYQADVRRPTNTLSGGESFLISLSLALGLSRVSSRKTRVDSLFLDEGFGTLDTETLEVALAALHNIRASGRTIGIISHVEMLKERIPVQIQLNKMPGGLSSIKIEEAL